MTRMWYRWIPQHFYLLLKGRIKIIRLYTDRIGHLASNTELFIREKYNPDYYYIVLVDDYISNQTLLNMFARKFCDKVIYNRYYRNLIQRLFPNKVIHHYKFEPNNYKAFQGEPLLNFTVGETWKGQKYLKKMGVDSWFVCFHNRDNTYLNQRKSDHKDFSYHNYRDSSIKNQIEAMNYITDMGGYAIRMGHMVKEPLQTDNPRIIDYASQFRNDFMDIFLPAHAKFFVGSASGLINVAYLFNTPIAEVNVTPLEYIDLPKGGLFIPKLVQSDNGLLSFEEILSDGVSGFLRTEHFTSWGLENVENSSDEILQVTKQMNLMIDGNWKDRNIRLQKKYWDLIKSWHRCYGSSACIGSSFIKKYEDLL